MCGIAGVFRLSRAPASLAAMGSKMTDALVHRGPDAGAVWVDAGAGLAIGHRRLSVIDLSEAGAQPMRSASGRYVLAFNGEIYNHLELRQSLGDSGWRGHSDTETLLAAIEAWGIQETLQRLVGMFAIALWDKTRRELVLARDRIGEKPLFYGWHRGVFLFGSELKAFSAYPDWCGEVDRGALTLFMRYGYVPTPFTIWQGIHKLPPGHVVTVDEKMAGSDQLVPASYWRASDACASPVDQSLDDDSAILALDSNLRQAVSAQMVADVPLGAFLSGGVDSSTVVAIMQALSTRPVRTFTIGFSESDYDEARHAKAVASHLGTEHTELYLGASDALSVIPRLADIYDEPFGDSSQLPTILVAAMARRHVTVCLSGDGGDEVFGGYNRYVWAPRVWRRIENMPIRLRRMAGEAVTAISPHAWDSFGASLPNRWRQPTFGDRVHKLAGLLDCADTAQLYRRLISQNRTPTSVVLGGSEAKTWAENEAKLFGAKLPTEAFVERMMHQDLVGYLPDDILVKVDRAAMAASLESRIPFLDHQLIQFVWRLPMHMKIRDGQGKWLLRQVLYRYVPKELIERPKQGFGVPIDSWLRGPLREWAESLLDESRIRQEGWLDPAHVRQKWNEHLSGRRHWQHWFWNVLMLQAWRERWA